MKGKIFLRRLLNQYREPDGKKKLYFFLLCLFCSAFFWLFIKLSREAEMVIEQPIAVSNVPEEVVVSHLSQRKVQFTMRATGLRLLVQNFFLANDTLVFDARQLAPIAEGGEPLFIIPSTKLIRQMANRLDAEKFVINVSPDTVYVRFSFAAEKMVSVLANVSLSFSKGFGQTDHLRIEPDSIKVRGPRNVVDTLSAIHTHPMVLVNLDKEAINLVDLVNPALEKGLSLGTNQVEIFIPVGEFLQTSLELPLGIRRQDSEGFRGSEVILFPNRVTITLLASKKFIESIDTTLVEAYVNCPIELPPATKRLDVHIGRMPPFVQIVSIEPPQVEFLKQP
ncbi:MAG TPA: hypothetical protein VLH37_10085 [Bacteroidales bacterium]|nr:hypothetical protein [Bacteroidales bacterium]